MLIFGIIFAIGAVAFALQNNVAVTVSFALWSFESSLAMVLLIALGLGALITALLSSPSVIRRQWTGNRLHHQIDALKSENSVLAQRIADLEKQLSALDQPLAPPAQEPAYVGLTSLFSGNGKSPAQKI
jgi:putative membrane protein